MGVTSHSAHSFPRQLSRWAVCVVVSLFAACGGSGPGPSPIPPPPPPPPPPANNVPVIDSISVQGTRPQEPPTFADVNEVVTVEARVRDDETAVDQLTYNWSAPVGTFSGTGARVTWQAPPTAQTPPQPVTLTLQVVERYGTNLEHRVSKTVDVMLHDSLKEVGDMARQFLLDFSDSSKDASVVLRNFDPNCYGYGPELEDVNDNRRELRIVASEIGIPQVTVRFGGLCPFRNRAGDACAQVRVFWSSVRASDGVFMGNSRGVDQVAAMYSRDQKRWRLCDSQFNPDPGTFVPRSLRR